MTTYTSLFSGQTWNFGSIGSIKYTYDDAFFSTHSGALPDALSGISDGNSSVGDDVIELWEGIASVSFSFESTPANAYLGIIEVSDIGGGHDGVTKRDPQAGTITSAGVAVKNDSSGNEELWTYLHEIGHTLGLDHPNGNGNNSYYNQSMTVMSYNTVADGITGVHAITPMILDIKALHSLYGSTSHNSGNNYYSYEGDEYAALTIYDTGGTDWLAVGTLSPNSTIDLRAGLGHESIIGHTHIWIFDTSVIENAAGGEGNDRLTGNDANNALEGNDGDDTLEGGVGADTLTGGDGEDVFVITDGNDVIIDFDEASDEIIDLSYFAAFDYNLEANAIEVGDSISGYDTELYLESETILVKGVRKATLFADAANFSGLISGTAGATITGTSSAELLDSVDGATANNDTITGLGNNDTLSGGAGSDTYIFNKGNGSDVIVEAPNSAHSNILKVNANLSEIYLQGWAYDLYVYVNDGSAQGSVQISNEWYNTPGTNGWPIRFLQANDGVLDLASTGLTYRTPTGVTGNFYSRTDAATNDTLLGGNNADTLRAGSGNNVINGGASADTVYGYAGADTITGGTGNDEIWSGAGNDTHIFNKGDGNDIVVETQSTSDTSNVLRINANLSEIYLQGWAYDLFVYVNDGSAQGYVEIDQQWASTPTSNGWRIKTIEANNGSIDLSTSSGLNYSTPTGVTGNFYSRQDSAVADTLTGGNNADILRAGSGNNVINGGTGADTVYGYAGADTITGGTGNDELWSGTGNDRHLFNKGDGNDAVVETQSTSDTSNVLVINANLADIYLQGWGYDLFVYVNDGSAQGYVRIVNEWYNAPTTNGWCINTIEANNGSIDLTTSSGLTYSTPVGIAANFYSRQDSAVADTLTGSNNADTLRGGTGNNTFDGGTGDDNMYGYAGNDTFNFGTGGGHDAVYDTSGSNVLAISGGIHHYTDSGAGNADRTYYLDATNTDWIFVDDFNLYSWSVV